MVNGLEGNRGYYDCVVGTPVDVRVTVAKHLLLIRTLRGRREQRVVIAEKVAGRRWRRRLSLHTLKDIWRGSHRLRATCQKPSGQHNRQQARRELDVFLCLIHFIPYFLSRFIAFWIASVFGSHSNRRAMLDSP